MIESFDAMGVHPSLVAALKKENITIPTDIQQKVIPEALKNVDLIAQSETGSGKTLAFLLPLFERLNASIKEMQVIIMVPTHELAIQILRQIERLSENSDIKLKGTSIIGNVNIERQIDKLKEKPHILVGSAGRILELIKKRKITAHTIKTIILDEADRLMDDNNRDNVKAVVKSTLKERQLMMFSASISKEAEAYGKEIMKEPVIIRGERRTTIPASIEHIYFVAEQRDKVEVLRKLARILNPEKALVFVNGSEENEIVTAKLKHHGLSAESIHGSHRKLERKKVMDDFRAGKLQLLIASDIAARGLDIEGITHIFNLNLPEDPKDYLHRAGRTGRMGKAGTVVSIITNREMEGVTTFEKVFKIKMLEKVMREGNIMDSKRVYGNLPVTQSSRKTKIRKDY